MSPSKRKVVSDDGLNYHRGTRAYLLWIQKTPRKKQALLLEPHRFEKNTPEYFYFMEQQYCSDYTERLIARGGKIKGQT